MRKHWAKDAFIHKLTTKCNLLSFFLQLNCHGPTRIGERYIIGSLALEYIYAASKHVFDEGISVNGIFLPSDSACEGSIFQVLEMGEEIRVLLDKFVYMKDALIFLVHCPEGID